MARSSLQLIRPSLSSLLDDNGFIIDLLVELTGADRARVTQKLAREHTRCGAAVEEDLQHWGLVPHVWSDRLSEFYERSDAFLYETLVWNRTLTKQQMRQWIADFLAMDSPNPQRAFMFGDGLGIDSLFLAEAGHQVDYYEVSDRCLRFAHRLSEPLGRDLSIVSSTNDLVPESYDVAVCLDVLEHVPDPSQVIKLLASLLRPGGRLIVHAPYWYIHRDVATHLQSNLRYSGDLSLYRAHGLRPIAARFFWNPIVLEKTAETAPTRASTANFTRILVGGLLLKVARIGRVPHILVWKLLSGPDRRRLAELATGLTAEANAFRIKPNIRRDVSH